MWQISIFTGPECRVKPARRWRAQGSGKGVEIRKLANK